MAVPEYSAYYYTRDRLAVVWRRSLTRRVLDRYFRNHAFYRLHTEAEIDNPDQRIADDIYSITSQSVNFLLIVASAVFQVVAFGRVLWRISGYLILFLVVYATITTLLTYGVFGGKMVSLHYQQRRKEADSGSGWSVSVKRGVHFPVSRRKAGIKQSAGPVRRPV